MSVDLGTLQKIAIQSELELLYVPCGWPSRIGVLGSTTCDEYRRRSIHGIGPTSYFCRENKTLVVTTCCNKSCRCDRWGDEQVMKLDQFLRCAARRGCDFFFSFFPSFSFDESGLCSIKKTKNQNGSGSVPQYRGLRDSCIKFEALDRKRNGR